jgi:hypothetical protein
MIMLCEKTARICQGSKLTHESAPPGGGLTFGRPTSTAVDVDPVDKASSCLSG